MTDMAIDNVLNVFFIYIEWNWQIEVTCIVYNIRHIDNILCRTIHYNVVIKDITCQFPHDVISNTGYISQLAFIL